MRGFFRDRFMRENILDRRPEGKRLWVREEGASTFYNDIYSTYSIHTRRYMGIDSTFSFYLLTNKNKTCVYTYYMYLYISTYLTCSKYLSFFGL